MEKYSWGEKPPTLQWDNDSANSRAQENKKIQVTNWGIF